MGYYDEYLKELQQQTELQADETKRLMAERQKALRDILSARGLSVSGAGLKQLGEIEEAGLGAIERGRSALSLETARTRALEKAEQEARSNAMKQALATAIGTGAGALLGFGVGNPLLGATLGGIAGSTIGRFITGTPEGLAGVPREIAAGLELLSDDELKKVWEGINDYYKKLNSEESNEYKPIGEAPPFWQS